MRVLFIALISAIILSSCHYVMGERVYGNGHVVTRESNPGSFNSVDVSSAMEVHVRQDESPSVKIETDENLLEYVDVFTRGETLVIRTRNGYNLDPSKEIVVYVSAPVYKSIEVSGASKIIGEGSLSSDGDIELNGSGASNITLEFSGGKLYGDISGATSMDLKGRVQTLELQGSGASHIRAFDLVSDQASVDLSGASSAELTANSKLDAEASGASHIRYKGAASVSQHTSGASSITKEG